MLVTGAISLARFWKTLDKTRASDNIIELGLCSHCSMRIDMSELATAICTQQVAEFILLNSPHQ